MLDFSKFDGVRWKFPDPMPYGSGIDICPVSRLAGNKKSLPRIDRAVPYRTGTGNPGDGGVPQTWIRFGFPG